MEETDREVGEAKGQICPWECGVMPLKKRINSCHKFSGARAAGH